MYPATMTAATPEHCRLKVSLSVYPPSLYHTKPWRGREIRGPSFPPLPSAMSDVFVPVWVFATRLNFISNESNLLKFITDKKDYMHQIRLHRLDWMAKRSSCCKKKIFSCNWVWGHNFHFMAMVFLSRQKLKEIISHFVFLRPRQTWRRVSFQRAISAYFIKVTFMMFNVLCQNVGLTFQDEDYWDNSFFPRDARERPLICKYHPSSWRIVNLCFHTYGDAGGI